MKKKKVQAEQDRELIQKSSDAKLKIQFDLTKIKMPTKEEIEEFNRQMEEYRRNIRRPVNFRKFPPIGAVQPALLAT